MQPFAIATAQGNCSMQHKTHLNKYDMTCMHAAADAHALRRRPVGPSRNGHAGSCKGKPQTSNTQPPQPGRISSCSERMIAPYNWGACTQPQQRLTTPVDREKQGAACSNGVHSKGRLGFQSLWPTHGTEHRPTASLAIQARHGPRRQAPLALYQNRNEDRG